MYKNLGRRSFRFVRVHAFDRLKRNKNSQFLFLTNPDSNRECYSLICTYQYYPTNDNVYVLYIS